MAGRCRAPEISGFVATRIKALRKRRGMSQSELGKACGISFQQVQKMESGTNRASADALWLMAKKLEVPVWYFFPTTDGKKPALDEKPVFDPLLKDEIRGLAEQAQKIADRVSA